MKNNVMGFVGSKVKVQNSVDVTFDPKEAILTFDSGKAITRQNLPFHTLALGTTGSGKTSSVVLPMLYKILQLGMHGLIIDIKGNLSEHVRALAKTTGREKDIVEFGTSPTATPLNILEGLSASAMRNYLEQIVNNDFQGRTNNMDFHMKGVTQAVQCAQMLILMSGTATLSLLLEIFNNPLAASKLYVYFKENVAALCPDAQDAAKELIASIDADNFHLLHYAQFNGDDDKRKNKVSEKTYFEQSSYAMKTIKNALQHIIDIPRVERGFCSFGAPGLAMDTMLEEGKIVLLRFSSEAGSVGAGLSRRLIESYYESIQLMGVEKSAAHPSFICIDEFQAVADLSSARFSDANFVSQAREFGSAFIASTQSASALLNRSQSEAAVEAFISNCNNRILFYSDDPMTQRFVSRYSSDTQLIDLTSGQVFTKLYNSDVREHKYGLETVNTAYSNVEKLLKAHKDMYAISSSQDIADNEDCVHLQTITEQARHVVAVYAQKKEKKNVQDVEVPLSDVCSDNKEHATTENTYAKSAMKQTITSKILTEKFPEFFKKSLILNLPIVWIDIVEKALYAIKKSGLSMNIRSFIVKNEVAYVQEYTGQDMLAINILNVLLQATKKICPLCRKEKDIHDELVCQSCLDLRNNFSSVDKLYKKDAMSDIIMPTESSVDTFKC